MDKNNSELQEFIYICYMYVWYIYTHTCVYICTHSHMWYTPKSAFFSAFFHSLLCLWDSLRLLHVAVFHLFHNITLYKYTTFIHYISGRYLSCVQFGYNNYYINITHTFGGHMKYHSCWIHTQGNTRFWVP